MFDAAAQDAAVASHERAAETAGERTRLEAALAETEDLALEIARLEERRSNDAQRELEVLGELQTLAFDPDALPAMNDAVNEADAAVEAAQEALTIAGNEAAIRDEGVTALRAHVAEAEAHQNTVEERSREARQHSAAGDLLSQYRGAQHQRAWQKLEIGAGSLLSQTTDGRYADVRLSEDYKLMIVDRGEKHGLERYSGGEQDFANLCLRLAIADWVARERGVEMGFVGLDEVFGSQDEDRRRRLLGQLRTLGNRFHQTLVITHLPDIAELCEHQLQVELVEDGRSTAHYSDWDDL